MHSAFLCRFCFDLRVAILKINYLGKQQFLVKYVYESEQSGGSKLDQTNNTLYLIFQQHQVKNILFSQLGTFFGSLQIGFNHSQLTGNLCNITEYKYLFDMYIWNKHENRRLVKQTANFHTYTKGYILKHLKILQYFAKY